MTLAQFGALPEWEQELRVAKVIRERDRRQELIKKFKEPKDDKGRMKAWTPEVAALLWTEFFIGLGEAGR